MVCNNPKLDLVNMNVYIKFGENMSVSSQDIKQKRNFAANQGPYLWYKCEKMMCNNPKLDLAKMNPDIKFGEIFLIGSQEIEGKEILAEYQGP